MRRDILHLKIDSFPATVEQQARPSLRGKSVIIGVPKGNTSVVFSASSEAHKVGVTKDMSLRRAQRICPDAVVLRADHAVYRQVFDDFLGLCSRYSPLLEPETLGSAWLDVTGSGELFGRPNEIAARISREVLGHLGLSMSVGCASNKLVARIASGMDRKFTRVLPGCESRFISTLPVTVLDSIDAKIGKRLNELGISKVGQLVQIPEALFARQFGPIGSMIRRQSLGLDYSPVHAAYPPEVISIEHLCDPPLCEPAQVEQRLSRMVNKAVVKLGQKNALAGEVSLVIYDESESGQPAPTPAYLRFKKPTSSAFMMMQALNKLVNAKMQAGMEVSRVQLALSDLSRLNSRQLNLVENDYARDQLDKAVWLIRQRFGDDAVFHAASLLPSRGRGQLLPRSI